MSSIANQINDDSPNSLITSGTITGAKNEKFFTATRKCRVMISTKKSYWAISVNKNSTSSSDGDIISTQFNNSVGFLIELKNENILLPHNYKAICQCRYSYGSSIVSLDLNAGDYLHAYVNANSSFDYKVYEL